TESDHEGREAYRPHAARELTRRESHDERPGAEAEGVTVSVEGSYCTRPGELGGAGARSATDPRERGHLRDAAAGRRSTAAAGSGRAVPRRVAALGAPRHRRHRAARRPPLGVPWVRTALQHGVDG